MKTKMEQFPATNPNPVISVGKDGRVLYSNAAGEPLLREWGVVVGEKLPSFIGEFVQGVIFRNSPEKMEVKVGNKVYLVAFHPLPEEECVNIYGFDISDQKELEKILRIKEKQNDVLHKIGKIALEYESLQTFMDESLRLIASILELEYCKIMELLPDGNVLLRAGIGWKPEFVGKHVVGGEKESQAGYTLLSRIPVIVEDFEEENRFNKPKILKIHGVASGASVVIGSMGKTFGVLIVNSTKKKKFTSDDTYFLSSVAFLIEQAIGRKKAEEALRLSNIYNRSLIEASLDPLVTIGRDGKITDMNGATEQVTGYSRYDLIGTDFSDYFTEPEKARTGYQQVFTDGEVRDYPLEIQHKDRHITPVLYSSSVYRDENNEVIGVFAAACDITERKKVEEALKKAHDNLENLVKERTTELEKAYISLKESEKGLAEAQRMAHLGNWVLDLVTGEAYGSDEIYCIFGRSPEEFGTTHDAFLSHIHPEDRDYVNNAVMEALNGKPYSINFRIILPDGEERTAHEQGEVVFNEKNIPIRMKGTTQDITEFKKAEEKILNLANIVESSNDAIGTISLDGIITSWNKGAEQVYGYSAEEVLGKTISILAPSHLDEETKKLSERIKKGEKVHQYETLRLRKNEKMICVSITLSPVFDTHRELTAVSFISRDITTIKEAEEKFIQEKQIAEVANRAKSEFLANMSHELRTPLNSIIGFSDLLYEQAYGELNEKQLRSVENVSKSGKHLLNLINDILDISKVEAGKLEFDYKDFELAAKFNIIRNLLSPIADRKNIKIEIEVDSKLKSIRAGEDRFVQIMYNLVDNAIKFSCEKGLVRIEARKKGDLVEITVKDTGIGIKAEDQDKLFKPFSQIGPFSSKRSQGTGLGLSLVKQIVHLHGGYIWFRSNLGEGSTFAFTIPLTNNKENRGYIELNQNV